MKVTLWAIKEVLNACLLVICILETPTEAGCGFSPVCKVYSDYSKPIDAGKDISVNRKSRLKFARVFVVEDGDGKDVNAECDKNRVH